MAIYQIGGQSIHSDDPALSELLANIYSSRERPLCLCRTPGIEMYVAKVDDKYQIISQTSAALRPVRESLVA